MQRFIITFGAAAILAGCGQPSDKAATNQAAVQPKKKPVFCFFKDEETKGWAASRGKDGTITVKGKAHVKDPRYKAVLGAPTVAGAGTGAEIAPSISPNDTGYAAPEDWWDLSAAIPNSAAIDTVTVRCGDKAVAELKVPLKG
jgi:hypothetical protein